MEEPRFEVIGLKRNKVIIVGRQIFNQVRWVDLVPLRYLSTY
jgi:hypothetical protein